MGRPCRPYVDKKASRSPSDRASAEEIGAFLVAGPDRVRLERPKIADLNVLPNGRVLSVEELHAGV